MIHQLILLLLTLNSSLESSYFKPVVVVVLYCFLSRIATEGPTQSVMDLDYLLASVVDSVLLPAKKDRQKVPRTGSLHLFCSCLPHPLPARPAIPADNTVIKKKY